MGSAVPPLNELKAWLIQPALAHANADKAYKLSWRALGQWKEQPCLKAAAVAAVAAVVVAVVVVVVTVAEGGWGG
jgi:hypothetical protein